MELDSHMQPGHHLSAVYWEGAAFVYTAQPLINLDKLSSAKYSEIPQWKKCRL
jgi:hypothetical protein